ncbi:MAG: HEAT repeat domain-containing protein [Bryobacteraceae bacterium]
MGLRFRTLAAAAAIWMLPPQAGAASLDSLVRKNGPIQAETIELRGLDTAHQYSLLYSLAALGGMTTGARVEIELRQGRAVLASKTLHAGDPDYYTQFRVPRSGAATLAVRTGQLAGNYTLLVNRWPLTSTVKSLPNRQWQDAVTIHLGRTVFASGDEDEYIPLPGTSRKEIAGRSGPADWYRFDFDGGPKLVFFQIELTDRDQIPVDVRVYRSVGGKLEEYFEGEDPVTLPHEVQAIPGNAFTPRILKEKGTYYIAVRAGYPEYRLRTRVYEPPPYRDPRAAVRTALDYILAAGDSWHVNTPRRGGVFDRVASVHQETSLCVGCHTTHFPLRAALYAARNGYPVVQRQQLEFLTERFYNNPRPFYGFEQDGAVWARVISAPANVLGRMAHLIDLFEQEISGEHRVGYREGIARYLNLYYSGRDKLAPDETNGNTPIVSAHEVAWYAWTVTKDPRMGDFIATGEVKNMIDLCYQTQALADIDGTRYRAQIRKNAERILSLQRPDGQWSMRFEANQPEVEFQTGHALWALQAAGIPVDHPQVAKAIDYLLKRQQAFGGWMDPLQSFENFRTPFRETQMAILALSAYFPVAGRANGWNSPPVEALSSDPAVLLEQLDQIWDPPSPEVRRQMEAAAESPDALIRQAAVEALGRLGQPDTVSTKLLGDPSKMVQRTAAWALRQSYSRHAGAPAGELVAALSSSDERTRWGTTRVFAEHFAALARRPEFAPPLLRLVADPSMNVRMNAVKALWQFWFWSADLPAKNRIEDTLLSAMAQPQPEWVESNLRDAIYNLADENIRYLYNNWVALLGQPADRERAIRGRLAVEARLAGKFAAVLLSGPDAQKRDLLKALTEYPLRRGDVYDPETDLDHKPAAPVYNRIGNDIEQIAFFGESANQLAGAIAPLLGSPDAGMRRLAAKAALLVRDNRFADVNRIAGPAGPAVKQLIAALDTMPEAADVARALHPAPAMSDAGGGTRPPGQRPQAKLDEAFFRGYVQPILEKRGKDGYACVHCHAIHTLFDGTYATAMHVVEAADPENSLILRKPTSSSETEGVAGSTTLAHGGGVRFTKDSPEYATILAWIKGAKE